MDVYGNRRDSRRLGAFPPSSVSITESRPSRSTRPTAAQRIVLGARVRWRHSRTPAPMDAASAPLVNIAATAPIHTISGAPNLAAMVAAVIWPTSPHSEKKMAAKETMAACDAGYSLALGSRLSGLRHRA